MATPLRLLVAALCGVPLIGFASVNAITGGLKGDGVTDDTLALQKLLGEDGVEIIFPKGTYLFGTVNVPSNVTLRGEAGAKIRPNPATIRTYLDGPASKSNLRCVFALKGNQITLTDLEFDFLLTQADDVKAAQRPEVLILGHGNKVVRLCRLTANSPERAAPLPVAERKRSRYPKMPANKASIGLAKFEKGEDIVMEYCRATHLGLMLSLKHCKRVWSLNNSAESCGAITYSLLGEEFLWHMGNWSRDVRHQCRWWGGNANDIRSLKPGKEGWGTMNIVKRGSLDAEPDANPYTVGAFDVFVSHNYADYGRTLAWGSKARHVIFDHNIGRFMNDYVIGTEGSEDVIFDSNIVINSSTAGLACYYWSEKVVMTGNIVLVRDEPIDMNYSCFPDAKRYQGGLVRLHAVSGRPNTVNGAGQVLMTGNLFLNELADKPRGIRIEAGREVRISSNRIKNGEIRTKGGSGPLTITDNEFAMTLPHIGTWITISELVPQAVISNNTFRSTAPLENRSPTEVLILAQANGSEKGSRLRVIDGNLIEGFRTGVFARALSEKNPDRFIVRNNTLDGAIRFEGLKTSYLVNYTNNLNLNTLQPVQPETLDRKPQKMPEAQPLPEDFDRADDGQEDDAE
jgi:hypothetical protein